MVKTAYRLLIVAVGIGLALFAPNVIPSAYWMRLVNIALINVIAVMGLDFSWGLCGQVSFAQAAFFGIGSYTSAILMVDHGLSFWAALPFVFLVSLAFGIALGLPTLRLRAQYLALATIGFQQVAYLVLESWTPITHGAFGIGTIPVPSVGGFQLNSDRRYYYLILAFIVAASIAYVRIRNSRIGRGMQSVREAELASEAMGVPTTKIKVTAFALSAVYAGIGGALYASLVGYIGPDSFNFAKAVEFVTMLLIGGPGYLAGSLIGAPLLTFVPEWLRFLQTYGSAVDALIIILLLIYRPGGLWGLVRMGAKRFVSLMRRTRMTATA